MYNGRTFNAPVGNEKEVKVFSNRWVTRFQFDRVREITRSPEFSFACGQIPDASRQSGPFSFLWYDISGVLHRERIGQNRVIYAVTSH